MIDDLEGRGQIMSFNFFSALHQGGLTASGNCVGLRMAKESLIAVGPERFMDPKSCPFA